MMHNTSQLCCDMNTGYFDSQQQKITKYNGSYSKYPLLQQCISSKNSVKKYVFKSISQASHYKNGHKLSQNSYGTLKTVNCQTISSILTYVRRQYRISIKNYLKRKYEKVGYLIPVQALQVVRHVDFPNNMNQTSKMFQTKMLYFYKPFYFMGNLKYFLDSSNTCSKLSILGKLNLMRSILSCSLSYGGLDNFLMTSSNLYFEDSLDRFAINYTSMCGLALCVGDSFVQIEQFYEISPHLSTKILKNGITPSTQNSKTSRYSKIRSFFINSLCIISNKDLYLKMKTTQTQQVGKKIAQQQLTYIKQYLQKQLKSNEVIQFLSELKNREQFQKCLKKVIINEDENVTWGQVLSIFYCTKQYDDQKLKEYKTKKNENLAQASKIFKQIHRILWDKQTDRQFYQSREIHEIKLYIPIKYKAELQSIIEYQYWWQLFYNDFNFNHETFCEKLLDQLFSINDPQKTRQNNRNLTVTKAIDIIRKYMRYGQVFLDQIVEKVNKSQ